MHHWSAPTANSNAPRALQSAFTFVTRRETSGVGRRCVDQRPSLRLSLFILLIASPAGVVAADPPNDCEIHARYVPTTVPSEQGDPCGVTQRILPPDNDVPAYHWYTDPTPIVTDPSRWSCCWDAMTSARGGESHGPISPGWNAGGGVDGGLLFPTGFRFNFNLLSGPASIGDFLPPSPTIGGSSAALVPPGAAGLSTGWQGVGRPTLGGCADLVTGLPLIQTTDLELSFGGARFRLTRTRSGLQEQHASAFPGFGDGVGQDMWWDWGGAGWMIGENPLLLIDSALPDVVGPNPRVTWLVLDAHHAIPFQQVNLASVGSPRIGYEAPPRFRARMRHNGTWGIIKGPDDNEVYGWIVAPTQYEVWLYDGLLKYTFAAIQTPLPTNPGPDSVYSVPLGDDVPLKNWNAGTEQAPTWVMTSYHELARYEAGISLDPFSNKSPGWGIPFYGLCTKIEDRHNHIVEISYCEPNRDNSLDDPVTTGCVECQQHCLRKGMIRNIRLKSGSQVEWTLLYAYRLFTGWGTTIFGPPEPDSWPNFSQIDESIRTPLGSAAIDRIFVYRGDYFDAGHNPGAESSCLIVPASNSPYDDEATDPLDDIADSPWVYTVRNWYRTSTWNDGGPLQPVPVLIRTTVTTRDQMGDDGPGIEGTERDRHTFYRYSWGTYDGEAETDLFLPFLERVYTNEDYERLRAWAADVPAEGAPAEDTTLSDWIRALDGPQGFAVADHTQITAKAESALSDGNLERLKGFASICLDVKDYGEGGHWPDESVSWAPTSARLLSGGYVTIDRSRLVAEVSHQTVGRISVKDGNGPSRHYRLHRLVVLPAPLGEEALYGHAFVEEGFSTLPWNLPPPKRSMFAHPYRWCSVGTAGVSYPNGAEDAAVLTEPRWIDVIDEFRTRDSMLDSTTTYSDTDLAIKEGQQSRRRSDQRGWLRAQRQDLGVYGRRRAGFGRRARRAVHLRIHPESVPDRRGGSCPARRQG